ncbi:hypothetical protein CC78DRAFT_589627 [Lojkania enalia]|uniref:Heterokaryon incompatibility domain-containing protein n=1 Tax=Lojkania enalia TaxID=147567 RepID=A0A9P4K0S8_9PLEO|nr:hypothetical protein CC78DRAFT_589627 [Didymosphaeria enalia]
MTSGLYTPLREDDLEICILDISPAEGFNLLIACSFRNVSLNSNSYARYIALSYTWGDADHMSYISVDGAKCIILPNLASTLRQIRGSKERISL